MNRLGGETSPYLRQHADNPVDWYPWGPEALEAAKRADKPILLSVGYSACHWCHVMAHESFEDPETAAVMNELFVNVKVDREERPDVDAIYMTAVQALTGRGGWPMTVFLTPAAEPFAGGTYFPKESHGHGPTFVEVLRRVAAAWARQREEVLDNAAKLTASISRSGDLVAAPDLPGQAVVERCQTELGRRYDPEHGGFGPPPKFPETGGHELLLRWHVATGDPAALDMVTTSLDAMASGGIYDHLGGGFARYSTDREWIVPHFEKMLYDNALLTRTYLHAWQITGNEVYLQVADETISYVLDEMRDPEGGFFSAEDADSEGEEGRFYVWTPEQIEAVLGDDSAEFNSWYGVTEVGNFEGRNILCRPVRGDLVRPMSVELSRIRLHSAREMRIRPGLDDKVLTEWNALMLSSLAEAAKVTANHRWRDAAVRNGTFLLTHLRRHDGRWMRSWQRTTGGPQQPARHLAYAADLACLVDAFTRLNEATGERRWLAEASEVADQLLALFWDDRNGGFFTTGSDAPELITRPKDIPDGAVPSANSTAAVALIRLTALTGEGRYRDHAVETVRWLTDVATNHPTAVTHLLYAVELLTTPMTEIVIPGSPDDLLDVVRPAFLPHAVLAWGESTDAPIWQGRTEGHAYVCQDATCALPATTPEELARQLGV